MHVEFHVSLTCLRQLLCASDRNIHTWPICKRNSSWIAFHVLAIWYILAKGVYHTIPLIKEMFYDLELEEECADILDKFPWMSSDIDAFGAKNKPNNIQIRTKVLDKGQKSKSSTTAGQSNGSSISPLNPIRENGVIEDMEE